jgi:hypothetical protein
MQGIITLPILNQKSHRQTAGQRSIKSKEGRFCFFAFLPIPTLFFGL